MDTIFFILIAATFTVGNFLIIRKIKRRIGDPVYVIGVSAFFIIIFSLILSILVEFYLNIQINTMYSASVIVMSSMAGSVVGCALALRSRAAATNSSSAGSTKVRKRR